jgi:hypothetical protein
MSSLADDVKKSSRDVSVVQILRKPLRLTRVATSCAMATCLCPCQKFTQHESDPVMKFAAIFGVLLFVCTDSAVRADVIAATDQGVSVRTTVVVKGTPEETWQHLLRVQTWWSPAHSWSGDAANLSITAEPGGGFEEKLSGGGFVRHMEVVYCDPGKLLRMTGALGPLQDSAVQGTMTIALRKTDDSTSITTTYHLSGYFPAGLKNIAPNVDQVITEQFQRLGKRIAGTLDEESK